MSFSKWVGEPDQVPPHHYQAVRKISHSTTSIAGIASLKSDLTEGRRRRAGAWNARFEARTIEIKPLGQGDDVMFHIKAQKDGKKENAARSIVNCPTI